MAGESRQQELVMAGHMTSTVRRQTRMTSSSGVFYVHYIQSSIPIQGMVLPTLRWVFSQPGLQELVPGQAPKLQRNPVSRNQPTKKRRDFPHQFT